MGKRHIRILDSSCFGFNGLHCVQANMARSDDIFTDVPGTVYLVDGRYFSLN